LNRFDAGIECLCSLKSQALERHFEQIVVGASGGGGRSGNRGSGVVHRIRTGIRTSAPKKRILEVSKSFDQHRARRIPDCNGFVIYLSNELSLVQRQRKRPLKCYNFVRFAPSIPVQSRLGILVDNVFDRRVRLKLARRIEENHVPERYVLPHVPQLHQVRFFPFWQVSNRFVKSESDVNVLIGAVIVKGHPVIGTPCLDLGHHGINPFANGTFADDQYRLVVVPLPLALHMVHRAWSLFVVENRPVKVPVPWLQFRSRCGGYR
jgi:hypothetical protein